MNKIVKSTLLGGIIVYAWSMVSWMALPWHNQVMHPFDHDVDVVRMLDFGTPASGIYIYPPMAAKEMKTGGPMAFVSFSKGGARPMGQAILLGIALQVFGAFLFSWLLSKAVGLSYGQKVLFASVFGLAIGLLGAGPNWVWWSFGPGYTLVSITDSLIAWTLAGLAIGKVG